MIQPSTRHNLVLVKSGIFFCLICQHHIQNVHFFLNITLTTFRNFFMMFKLQFIKQYYERYNRIHMEKEKIETKSRDLVMRNRRISFSKPLHSAADPGFSETLVLSINRVQNGLPLVHLGTSGAPRKAGCSAGEQTDRETLRHFKVRSLKPSGHTLQATFIFKEDTRHHRRKLFELRWIIRRIQQRSCRPIDPLNKRSERAKSSLVQKIASQQPLHGCSQVTHTEVYDKLRYHRLNSGLFFRKMVLFVEAIWKDGY
uniref:Ribosomal protein S10 n=1 Tax=Denticeps clupeoides TaxID=299321 RepID=A0AAY4ACG7_9TELE